MPENTFPLGSLLNSGYGQSLMGVYGSALSPEMRQQMMPMGMMNRSGQEMMGQSGDSSVGTENNPVNNAIYGLIGQAVKGIGNKMQGQIQGNPVQIIRDQNQFRFAGQQQNPQMLAQALRRSG
jgi:hypothetical protein